MKKRKVRIWLWGIVGAVLLVILLTQATFFFFGGKILKESILLGFQKYSEENFEPQNRPELDFEDLSISLFTGNISITGLYFSGYVNADSGIVNPVDHIKMMVHETELLGIDFFELYRHRNLRINDINFYRPEIQWVNGVRNDSVKLNPKNKIKQITENLENHITQYIYEISFASLNIIDGNIFITQEYNNAADRQNDTVINNKFNAQEVHLSLYDFLLDSSSSIQKGRFLFSRDIDIQLVNYQFLADSTFLLKADTLGFSTRKMEVYLSDFELLPLTQQRKKGAQVVIPTVKLTQIDWRDLYFDSLLLADQLVFDKPNVLLQINENETLENPFAQLTLLNADSLFSRLSNRLKKIKINDIALSDGQIALKKPEKDTLEVLYADGIDILLANINMDSTLRVDTINNVLPADTFTLGVQNIKLFLPDNRHYFTSQNVFLHTEKLRNFACDIHFESLKFKAGVDSLDELLHNRPEKPLAFDVEVPKVSFFGIQLTNLYEVRAAVLDSIYINKPKVSIANFGNLSLGKLAAGVEATNINANDTAQESVKSLLYDWSNAKLNLSPVISPGNSSALFQNLHAGQLKIDSGSFNIFKAKEDSSGFIQITAIDTFYAFLDRISIDDLQSDSIFVSHGKVAVLANEVDIHLKSSKFLLPGEKGEGGLFSVENVGISTLKKEAYFKNIYFWTNPDRPPSTEVWLHRMYIPYVKFNDVTLEQIYVNQNAYIRNLTVYSPKVMLNYKKNNLPRRELKFDFKNLYPQLSSYLNQLSVPDIKVKNAKLRLQKISNKGVEPLFTTDNLNIQMKGFFLDSLTRMNRLKPFYADLLEVSAENYQWNFYPEDESYPLLGVKGKSMNFNSYEGQLDASQLTMLTNTTERSDLQHLQLLCDKILADDIDAYQLIHNKYLNVGRVMINAPSYKVEERKINEEEDQDQVLSRKMIQPDLNTLLNQNLKNVHLRLVSVTNGALNYTQKYSSDTISYVQIDSIDFRAKDLIINGKKERHLNNILYANDIDFSFFADQIFSNNSKEGNQKVIINKAYFSSRDAQLRVSHLQFIPPHNLYHYKDKTHFNLNAHGLNVRGLDFNKAYLYGEFKVQTIDIDESALILYMGERSPTKKRKAPDSIHDIISPYLENISVDMINYPQGSLKIYEKKSKELRFMSSKIKADITDFYVDQSSFSLNFGADQAASAKMFFSDDINIKIQDYSRELDDGMYKMFAEEVSIESGKKRIEINGLRLKSQLNKEQMLNRFTYSKSIADVSIDRIEMNQVNFEALFDKEQFLVEELLLYEPRLSIFKDNQLPRDDSKRPAINQQLLKKFKNHIRIDKLSVLDGSISYAEEPKDSKEKGIITFDQLYLTASNLTNDPQAGRDSIVTTINVKAKVMNQGDLNTDFTFPLASKDFDFEVRGSLGEMDLTAFNSILEPVAFVHIKEGTNHGMKFNFSGNKDKSEGVMEFRYDNLSVQMIDKEKGKTGLGEKLESFIANAFILKASNPKGVFLRIGQIEIERDKSRSMFHYWWKSILSGVKSSIGLDKNMEKTKDYAEIKKD